MTPLGSALATKSSPQLARHRALAATVDYLRETLRQQRGRKRSNDSGDRLSRGSDFHLKPKPKLKMKISATRRGLILANIFNSLVAFYFITIAIVGLVQLRWYHQLTITVRVRHIITLTTSYFAFLILILVGLVLLGLFLGSSLRLSGGARGPAPILRPPQADENTEGEAEEARDLADKEALKTANLNSNQEHPFESGSGAGKRAVVLRDLSLSEETNSSVCCSILAHLLATVGLIAILLIWLFNTGELVRDSVSTQLDYAFARYQFSNRSNLYSVAIDGMQDVNNCCGSLDYSDFPHQRVSGLSSGHYPGSCCGKNIFGVNARVLCTAEEIWRAKQTVGCTTVLANYYDLISLLIVPVALVCLFVNITIIALITISKRGNASLGHHHQHLHHQHQRQAALVGLNQHQARRARSRQQQPTTLQEPGAQQQTEESIRI